MDTGSLEDVCVLCFYWSVPEQYSVTFVGRGSWSVEGDRTSFQSCDQCSFEFSSEQILGISLQMIYLVQNSV